MPDQTARAYKADRAARYDEETQYDKGNRQQHYDILIDLLKYTGKSRFDFCDLGCGTGTFIHAFFQVAPESHGLAVDASSEMIEIALRKLSGFGQNVKFICCDFQHLEWRDFVAHFDVIFSSMAIHHLAHPDKWRLFQSICNSLRPDGWFILYDLICCQDPRDTHLLEYLACSDIQRRLLSYLEADVVPEELSIDKLIKNDRELRLREGDMEAPLQEQVLALRRAGFASVVAVFQDTRIVGFACAKASSI